MNYLWIIVMFFISCLESRSDGTHSLQMILGEQVTVVIKFSKSVRMKKQTNLHRGWPEEEYIFLFGFTIPLNMNY